MRSNGVTIDFNQWMEHESNPLLAVLEYIQPVKDKRVLVIEFCIVIKR